MTRSAKGGGPSAWLLCACLAPGVLASCTASPLGRVSICEFVRAAAKDGSMPLDLVRAQYPECGAVDGK